MNIGKLENVNLRELWKHEAIDFTRWLAQDGLEILSKEVGLNLINPKTEQSVGGFFCDIICEDEFTNKKIIIENQLENTDHKHLGQIITYASGMDASCMIWIVEQARQEHKSAIEWLNNKTITGIDFFLIELRAYKIGNSNPAPKFEIVESPNEWSRAIKRGIESGEINKSKIRNLPFWENFNSILSNRKDIGLNATRAVASRHYCDFSIASLICHLSADLMWRDRFIRINFYIPDNKDLYDFVYKSKNTIENELKGVSLDWDRKEDKKPSSVSTNIDGLSFENQSNYNDLCNKIIDMLVRFRKVFLPIVNSFSA
ncbi:MAG: DUF4268 domain-containing protein [Firmicutes bacterium]|nr:DUF4268 domain-containing protein [Bacillota bacterium]MCL1953487.1 DUF4268 domain-containing protein [Bacillota bacterium]